MLVLFSSASYAWVVVPAVYRIKNFVQSSVTKYRRILAYRNRNCSTSSSLDHVRPERLPRGKFPFADKLRFPKPYKRISQHLPSKITTVNQTTPANTPPFRQTDGGNIVEPYGESNQGPVFRREFPATRFCTLIKVRAAHACIKSQTY